MAPRTTLPLCRRRDGDASWCVVLSAIHRRVRVVLVAIIVVIYVSLGAVCGSTGQMGSQGAEARAGIDALLRFPDSDRSLLGVIVELGGLLAVAYGAAVGGGDWNWGMVKVALARGESRSRYILIKLTAVVILLVPALTIAFTVGLLARSWRALAGQAAIGFAVATLARSQIAGLGAGIALYFAEQFLATFLLEYVRFLPFHASQELLATDAGRSLGWSQGNLPGARSTSLPRSCWSRPTWCSARLWPPSSSSGSISPGDRWRPARIPASGCGASPRAVHRLRPSPTMEASCRLPLVTGWRGSRLLTA